MNSRYNTQVDAFFAEGCGRCPLVSTPQCKVHQWQEELQTLRDLVLDGGLTEERKWGNPCYTLKGKNVIMMGALKESCTLSFFKGSLLKDEGKLLVAPGENSQANRQFRFTSIKEIQKHKKQIAAYIQEAIALEKEGKKVAFKKADEFLIPVELTEKFETSPEFKRAFYALTPGRQRGYLLHFSEPKQAATRLSRIEKHEDKIKRGEGLHDAYRNSK